MALSLFVNRVDGKISRTVLFSFIFFVLASLYIFIVKPYEDGKEGNCACEDESRRETIVTVSDSELFDILFDEVLGNNAIVMFYASWCSHCVNAFHKAVHVIDDHISAGNKLNVIFVSFDYNDKSFGDFVVKNDFKSFVPYRLESGASNRKEPDFQSRILRVLGVTFPGVIPFFVILDGSKLEERVIYSGSPSDMKLISKKLNELK